MQDLHYDISNLSNIDYIDSALCAIVADAFHKDKYSSFGDSEEGFIIDAKCRI